MEITGELRELWPMLLVGPENLTDKEIARLLENEDMLKDCAYRAWCNFPHGVNAVKRYRARMKELSALSTEKLQAMRESIARERSRTLAADVNDELDDSFYASPPLDSDEHIIYELLKARNALDAPAAVQSP
ncbi:hypothetical protein A2110_01265 [Candidatus Jorgensenbacteria bacterium GWA1_54_12]|uniref:Uncharacterized protein n=1 Tax=Candidatus Jorgensenbacteria bacterium GWA1_54_12 TaxID=1798468 RepID=A0A1F6BIS0_9BACT|nr:MAG: hypothetical protein A2110_01265 [Candidatus Jorgensenbacteria bacterium GWA1_54_12]